MKQDYSDDFKNACRFSSKKEVENLCYMALIDSYTRVKQVEKIHSLNENGIRDEFVIDLVQTNKLISLAVENYIIIIIPECWDPVKRNRTDIEFVLPSYKRRLIFECKKLSSAEKRYLDDGLIRFIELKYAEKEPDGGMIGFVVNGNFIKTISKLKEKVKCFHIIRLIDKQVLNYKYSFQSLHKRKNSTHILISHLFFKFS